jgi:hypothetical protein
VGRFEQPTGVVPKLGASPVKDNARTFPDAPSSADPLHATSFASFDDASNEYQNS